MEPRTCNECKHTQNNNKCKNHFNEMKGDVGVSGHEKEREQEAGQKVILNPIPTSPSNDLLSYSCPEINKLSKNYLPGLAILSMDWRHDE